MVGIIILSHDYNHMTITGDNFSQSLVRKIVLLRQQQKSFSKKENINAMIVK